MHKLGFTLHQYKMGEFYDGHEAPENIADRKDYLQKVREIEQRTIRVMPTQEEIEEFLKRKPEDRPYVEMIQDESICYAFDDESRAWVLENQPCPRLKPKSKGRGIMLSAFICELTGGILKDGEDTSVVFLEYGQGLWWTSERMIAQLEGVLDLAARLFPWAQFVFKFDHSSNHKAMAEDALNAKKMGVNSGGSQPKMRPGSWQGVEQKMVDEDGIPKGC